MPRARNLSGFLSKAGAFLSGFIFFSPPISQPSSGTRGHRSSSFAPPAKLAPRSSPLPSLLLLCLFCTSSQTHFPLARYLPPPVFALSVKRASPLPPPGALLLCLFCPLSGVLDAVLSSWDSALRLFGHCWARMREAERFAAGIARS